MLDQLWDGWRAAYVTSGGAAGGVRRHDTTSIFSQILASGMPDDETHIVQRGADAASPS